MRVRRPEVYIAVVGMMLVCCAFLWEIVAVRRESIPTELFRAAVKKFRSRSAVKSKPLEKQDLEKIEPKYAAKDDVIHLTGTKGHIIASHVRNDGTVYYDVTRKMAGMILHRKWEEPEIEGLAPRGLFFKKSQ